MDSSISISGEYIKRISCFEMGAGITLPAPRSIDGTDQDFYFIPVYGLLKLRSTSEEVAPYLTCHVGYNFFNSNRKYDASGAISFDEDIYWAGGIGVIFNNQLQFELLYTSNNGELKVPGYRFDVEYTKTTKYNVRGILKKIVLDYV